MHSTVCLLVSIILPLPAQFTVLYLHTGKQQESVDREDRVRLGVGTDLHKDGPQRHVKLGDG